MSRWNCWRILDTGGKKKKLLTIIRRRNFLGNTFKEFSLNREGGDILFTLSHLCLLNKSDIITYIIPDPQDYHESYVLQCDVLLSRFSINLYWSHNSEFKITSIPEAKCQFWVYPRHPRRNTHVIKNGLTVHCEVYTVHVTLTRESPTKSANLRI